jgi:dUTP pyrophosphatase
VKYDITVDVTTVSDKVGDTVQYPFYATEGAAGMDLCACLEQEIVLEPGARVQVPTGIAIKMPPGVVALLFPRSGNAWRSGITLSNAVGVVDQDYIGEIKVLLTNLGDKPFPVRPGDRVAQMVFLPVLQARLNLVDELESTERGSGGFGSTGR